MMFPPLLYLQNQSSPIILNVDATQAPMHIIHTDEMIPMHSGDQSLNFAQWIPGNHTPSGDIGALAGLHFYVNGTEIPWRRDLVDMYKFHFIMPSSGSVIEAKFDYLSPSSDAVLDTINWYETALFPNDQDLHRVIMQTNLTLPDGWKEGGTLDIDSQSANTIHFKPQSVSWLYDHPILTGKYLIEHPITDASSDDGEHAIDIVAESPDDLVISPEFATDLHNLVQQERAPFGNVGHYRKYHWLLTLTNGLGAFGVEHHECSDDRINEDTLTSGNGLHGFLAILLPHEFFHSWNGKFRRPIGLVNGGFTKPMEDDGLWVYEGLTEYYGEVMAARSGFWNEQQFMANMFSNYYSVIGPGRTWKPLQDTADFEANGGRGGGRQAAYGSFRRGSDYYAEGSLIWLETDVKIRQLTNGGKSLDDFLKLYAGESQGANGVVAMKPYKADEIYALLNKVTPYDWKGFLESRLNDKNPVPPLGGIENGGYKLTYSDGSQSGGSRRFGANFTTSIGLAVGAGGVISNEWVGSPAYNAGVGATMTIVTVNGQPYSADILRQAIIDNETTPSLIKLTLKQGKYTTEVTINYQGGLHIPAFEKDNSKPDIISNILAPRSDAK